MCIAELEMGKKIAVRTMITLLNLIAALESGVVTRVHAL